MESKQAEPLEAQASQVHLDVPDPWQASSSSTKATPGQETRRSASLTPLGSTTVYQSRLEPSQGDNDEKNSWLKTEHSCIEGGKLDHVGREFTLPPQDEGFGAWSYVAATFAMYTVVWGLPQALPVFQTLLSVGPNAKFPDSMAMSFLTPGIQDFQEGFLFQVLPRHAKYRVWIIMAGITTMVIGLFLASYAEEPWQVVVLHGHVFGLGGVMLNFVHVSIFPEWFDKRRGEAMGIIWVGFRLGSVASPLICNWLLEKHGYGQTLRVLLAPMLTLLGPSIFLLRGRYPAAAVVSEPSEPRLAIIGALRRPTVLFFLFVSMLFNMVTFMPVMFITTLGVDIGVRFSDAVVALSVHHIARMVGTYLAGRLVKGPHPSELLMGTLAVSTALIHLLVLGFCKDRFGIFVYAILIGLSTGGFDNALYPLFSDVSGTDGRLYTAIHSLFSFVRSLGTMSVGPIGVLILKRSPAVDISAFAVAKYKYLVMYGFGMAMASGVLSFVQLVQRNEAVHTLLAARGSKVAEAVDAEPHVSPDDARPNSSAH